MSISEPAIKLSLAKQLNDSSATLAGLEICVEAYIARILGDGIPLCICELGLKGPPHQKLHKVLEMGPEGVLSATGLHIMAFVSVCSIRCDLAHLMRTLFFTSNVHCLASLDG